MKKIFVLSILSLVLFSNCTKESNDILEFPEKKQKTDWGIVASSTDIDPCKEVCLVAGQHMYVGTVGVAEDNGDLYVTYKITADNIYFEEIHLDIFNSMEEFKNDGKVSNGGAIPGKFEYKVSFSSDEMVTSHTVMIPKNYVDYVGGANCVFIAAHAALTNGETAWGGLCDESENGVTNLDEAKQFPGRNWSVYFEFCAEECEQTINFTYAWEDLQNIGNDADYNDLVIKSDLIKSNDELKVTFFASARGAAFEHQFKIRIPKNGITNIFGAANVVDDPNDSNYYIITIFNSTQSALPGEGYGAHPYAANTMPEDNTCTPNATAEIVFTIDNSFTYDANKPYEPLITVYPFAPYGNVPYDLYIYEVSGRDTWVDGNGKEYPNGILIPYNWRWPLETIHIDTPYPDFKSLTDGWNPNWANNLANPSQVFMTCN